MDERQQRRIALNESKFRASNEGLVRALDDFNPEIATYSVMCECAVTQCEDMILVTPEEYGRARVNPRRFIVLPGHVLPAAEDPIEQGERFWIVEKIGAGAIAAEAQSPAG